MVIPEPKWGCDGICDSESERIEPLGEMTRTLAGNRSSDIIFGRSTARE